MSWPKTGILSNIIAKGIKDGSIIELAEAESAMIDERISQAINSKRNAKQNNMNAKPEIIKISPNDKWTFKDGTEMSYSDGWMVNVPGFGCWGPFKKKSEAQVFIDFNTDFSSLPDEFWHNVHACKMRKS